MRMKTAASAALLAIAVGATATPASAGGHLNCDNVQLNARLRSYPSLDNTCLDVIERDGKAWIKMRAQVRFSSTQRVTLQFQRPDGSWGGNFRANNTPRGFTANLDGQPVRLDQLSLGQELDLYIPVDQDGNMIGD